MKQLVNLMLWASLIALSGCSLIYDKEIEYEYVEPDSYPTLSAVGYAPVNAQSGKDHNEKVLRAMKASKLEAYRELAEQVYGQRLTSQSTVADMVLGNDAMKAKVDGVIRGAQVVRSYPVGDNYATEMTLDMKTVHQLYITVNKPRRVKDVHYY
ncbi:LPP20 family lipoprotein [Echinimonas agarilytica]|uniref:LPP20 family lipoprotein n=1 Tax=Echinimonas agarilytica TaxID=1215918 RepID=A0AA42B873_9GAMM|nr:LPP20 family lipoprotein [Echinimonas agarilytica]MCM2680078.1 LPP20 family lipoprotein [Echinimonas agarilytica]